MQTVVQALQNITNAMIYIASPVLVIALIVAGFNMFNHCNRNQISIIGLNHQGKQCKESKPLL